MQPSGVSLSDVYKRRDRELLLFNLLQERDTSVNISHKKLPAWGDHVKFIASKPYEAWYFVEVEGRVVGACYLTRHSEIGIFIFKQEQGNGFGPQAVKALIDKHGKRRYLANINPDNAKSSKLFVQLGFRPIQHTYEHE